MSTVQKVEGDMDNHIDEVSSESAASDEDDLTSHLVPSEPERPPIRLYMVK